MRPSHWANIMDYWIQMYIYGFEISLLGYEDAISLDKLHGNIKRQNTTKLEMDQLHEYNTFHDKGIWTTPGEEFKKIRVHLLVYACNHRILSCSVPWGVTIFPYVDKWTLAHVIWVSIGKWRTSRYSPCVTNENNNTCVGLD
jgi:hypothetical protein